jgi:hypothetical protein
MPRPQSRKAQDRLLAKRPLAYHLGSIGVKPCDPRAIEAYKASQLHKLHHPEQPHRKIRSYLMTIGVIALFAYGLGMYLTSSIVGTLAITGIGILASVITWVMSGPSTVNPKSLAAWRETTLDYFLTGMSEHVPAQALEVAEEIRTRLPQSEVTIEYLDRDPIMWIKHVHPRHVAERFAVHVWDEPGLTG